MKKFLFFLTFYLSLASLGPAQTPINFSLEDTTLAAQYSHKAKQLFKKSSYDSAAYYFELSSKIYQQLAINTNERTYWHKYIENMAQTAISFQNLKNNEKALNYFNEALKIAKSKLDKNDDTVTRLYEQIGKFCHNNHQYSLALKNYEKGLTLLKDIYGLSDQKAVLFYQNIGTCYLDSTDYKNAEIYFKKALSVLKANKQEESLRCSDIFALLGETNYTQGDYKKSIEYYNKCLNLRKKLHGENNDLLLAIYNYLGNSYYLIGNFDEAYDYYQQALLGFKKLDGEKRLAVAKQYNNLGMIFFEKHDYKKAHEYFQKALTLKRNLKGENDISTATSLNNVGLCLLKLHKFDDAIQNFKKSLKIRKSVLGKIHPDVASSYTYLGLAYKLKNDLESALKNYRQSLKINESLFGERHPKIAETFIVVGDLYTVQGHFSQALQSYQKALIALVPGFSDTNIYHNPPIEERLSDKYLINVLIAKGKAFAKFKKSPDQKLQNLTAAISTFELAYELVDKIILGYSSNQSKLFAAKYEQQISDNAIETLADLYGLTGDKNYQLQQFKFAQKAKFVVLQKSMYDSKAAIISGIPDSLLQRENDLRADISFFETQLQKQLQKKENQDSTKIVEYTQKSFALKQDYKNLIDLIEKQYPQYYHLKYRPREITVNDVQAALAEDEIMLDYLATFENLYIFAIDREQFNVAAVAIDDTISQLIDTFLSRIKKADVLNFAQDSHHLYKYLIQPVAAEVANKKKLIIIPHEELYQIPFDALLCEQMPADKLDFGQAKYLLDRFEISYYLSAGLYLENFSNQAIASRDRSSQFNGFLGFAPVFNEKSNTEAILADNLPIIKGDIDRSVTVDGKHFRGLNFSKDEVENVAALFLEKGIAAQTYLYKDASEENFKQDAPNYKFVHIATHGILNNDYPDLSGMIFSQPTDSIYQEDGVLYSAEIYNLALNADLVTLSSCQSGLGKLISGEGLLSLTRGFIYSGVKNLLVSLWKVSDKSSSQLMTDFYREVLNGKSYSAALREAKLKMIHNPLTAFPKLWGAFVLIGR